ncbi:hypothetical protein M404DRAFT_925601 [Pisolithus tinctorius Marx 270]|uniref:Uncharacterized protein n=1 Tax=Pisolithus tinctorius Marx 270 TaxID=870435 RepID=A0A0C3NNJ7_PISTI|nr:hypothetical protein M404DRAFT_925601 [Pisolithus tinctorius Marx 270]
MHKYRRRNTCLVSFKSSPLFFKLSTPAVRCSRRTAHVQWGTFIWVNLGQLDCLADVHSGVVRRSPKTGCWIASEILHCSVKNVKFKIFSMPGPTGQT